MWEGWVPGVCSFRSFQGVGSCWCVDHIWSSRARVLISPTVALPQSETRPVGWGHPHTPG